LPAQELFEAGWLEQPLIRKVLSVKYVIITPAHNEEKFIRFTLDSVVAQTVRPAQWLIVDDGSTDGTAGILREYAAVHAWIKPVSLPVEGKREFGARIARVFYEGYQRIDTDYDFIVELDSDLSFGPTYFEDLLKEFEQDPRLGIAGGGFYIPVGTQWQLEKVPLDHVRGASKVYRKACFDEIGGLPLVNGWDSIDEWRAQMKGWKTHSFNDLVVHHLRPTGASVGKWAAGVKAGEYAYFLGYPWLVILARSLYRALAERPLFVLGAGLFWGYLKSWLARTPQLDDPELIAYMRRKQMRRILYFWRPGSQPSLKTKTP
jgi:poly-beta-1,6-N-acetyl-D-glucosamine synthase